MYQVFSLFYQRYKVWFWFILFLVLELGSIFKYYHAHPLWDVWFQAVSGLVCLGVFFYLLSSRDKDEVVTSPKIKNGRLVVTFTLLGVFAGVTMLPFVLQTLRNAPMTEQLHVPLIGTAVLTVFQAAIMTLVTSFIGLTLAQKVGLDVPLLRSWLYEGRLPKLSRKWLTIAILGSFIGTFAIVIVDTYVFQPLIPNLSSTPPVSWWKNVLTMFYGGIVEEVLLRLFLMTLLVWVFAKLRKLQTTIPSYVYWSAIVLSAVLFGLGHLPATASLFGQLTPLLVTRAVVGNGLLGILFGYLYWKKGFEYAVISHMSGDLFLHVVWYASLA